MSYRRCKGTAVLGDTQISGGLSTEVVATGAWICDKALTRRWKCVATLVDSAVRKESLLTAATPRRRKATRRKPIT